MKMYEAKAVLADIESEHYVELQKESAVRCYCEKSFTIPSMYLKPVIKHLLCRLDEEREKTKEVYYMRYNNTDATPSKSGLVSEKTSELVDLIKATIFRDLRQKFEVDEVLEICRKIDEAARKYEEER